MVEIFVSVITQDKSPSLKITHNEANDEWHCCVYYDESDNPVTVMVPEDVKNTLKGDALNSFFIKEKERPGSEEIPTPTEEPLINIEIQVGKNQRKVSGSLRELIQFCQARPLYDFSKAAKTFLDNFNYRNEFIQFKCEDAEFTYAEKQLDSPATMQDFWLYQFSNIWNLTSELSEYIVAHALGIKRALNRSYWSLWDITYYSKDNKKIRIEVKSTADYHCWTFPTNKQTPRVFSIRTTHSRYKDVSSKKQRQSDIYVFCHNKGEDPEKNHPLHLENWDFYIIKTEDIDKKCKGQKTISLKKVISMANNKSYTHDNLRDAIEEIIPQLEQCPKEKL